MPPTDHPYLEGLPALLRAIEEDFRTFGLLLRLREVTEDDREHLFRWDWFMNVAQIECGLHPVAIDPDFCTRYLPGRRERIREAASTLPGRVVLALSSHAIVVLLKTSKGGEDGTNGEH